MIESKDIVSFVRLLGSFRKRILITCLFPVVFTLAVYFISDKIVMLLSELMKGQALYFIAPVDGIIAKIKISFISALVLSFPFVSWLIVSMFSAEMKKKTKLLANLLIIPLATIFLGCGIFFGYKAVLPRTIEFLIACGSDFLRPMITGNAYISFVAFMLITTGVIFEIPLMIVALSRVHIVNSRMLKEKRKFIIMGTVIFMAVLTPTPDAFTLLAVSIPIIFLFELSILWVFLLEKFDEKILRIKAD